MRIFTGKRMAKQCCCHAGAFPTRESQLPQFSKTAKRRFFALRNCEMLQILFRKTDGSTMMLLWWCKNHRFPNFVKKKNRKVYFFLRNCEMVQTLVGTRMAILLCWHVDAFLQGNHRFPNFVNKKTQNVVFTNLRNDATPCRNTDGRIVFPTQGITTFPIPLTKNAKCRFFFTKLRAGANPCRNTNQSTVWLPCWCIS